MKDDGHVSDDEFADAASPNPGAGNGGICECPECGHTQEHDVGVPCTAVKCSKCGAKMQRKTDSVDNEAVVAEAIANTTDVAEAEDVLFQILESDDVSLLTLAEARVDEMKSDGRERIEDTFIGRAEIVEDLEETPSDGSMRFRAIVAQSDKINKNRRFYPRKEFEDNLSRVNRMMKAGRFTGQDGHPGFFSGGNPSNICVRYDAVFIQKGNVYLEGAILPTSAGKDIQTLWEHGVQTEWSIIGYGDSKVIKADDSSDGKEYNEIRNYVWDGCDVVDRGAAQTQTVSFTKDNDDEQPEKEEAIIMEDKTEVVEDVVTPEPVAPVAPPAPVVVEAAVVEEVAVEPEYKVDTDAIAKQVGEKLLAQTQSVITDQVMAAHKAVNDAQALADAKATALAKLSEGNEDVAFLMRKHFDSCETIEQVAEALTEVTPKLSALTMQDKYAGIGRVTSKQDEQKKFWLPSFSGSVEGRDRPETVDGVFRDLMDGIEDTGLTVPSNPAYNMNTILNNYRDAYPQYFYACTKQGFVQDAVTTSTALGTMQPYILPLVRSLFPRLIPYEIQSVQPLKQKTGTIYYLDFEYASGDNSGSDMDDSGAFDSGWADHEEAAEKSQIAMDFDTVDITATEKSIYYNITSVLIQDLKAQHGLDAQQELLNEAVNEIARELNEQFLETMRAGATAATNTYGTAKPTDWNSQGEWYNQGLSMWVNRTSADIGAKVYTGANWIIGDTLAVGMLASMKQDWTTEANPVDSGFGLGLKRMGTFAPNYTVYLASWFTDNTLLFGFKPDDWKHAGAVFAPYIPLYYSPLQSEAAENRLLRSVSSRNAMACLQGDAFALLEIAQGETGAEPFD